MKLSDIKVNYIQHCGDDLSVANAARVSFHKESELEWCHDGDFQLAEKDVKLINYLAKHKHFSPFNHSFITLRVKAPIFVARQLVKHKFMPWNEVSRRYVDDEPEFYFPEHWRKKTSNVKQGSSDEHVTVWEITKYLKEDCEHAYLRYRNLIDTIGVCPEQARMILPQNMMTEWWWSGTLGAFCDMLRLRLDSHTQKETQEVAKQVRHIIEPLFPVSVKALLGET